MEKRGRTSPSHMRALGLSAPFRAPAVALAIPIMTDATLLEDLAAVDSQWT